MIFDFQSFFYPIIQINDFYIFNLSLKETQLLNRDYKRFFFHKTKYFIFVKNFIIN